MLPTEFLTPEEVARRLVVSGETVRRWIRDGELPAYRVGSRLRINPDDLDGLVKVARTPEPAEAVV